MSFLRDSGEFNDCKEEVCQVKSCPASNPGFAYLHVARVVCRQTILVEAEDSPVLALPRVFDDHEGAFRG